jgi:hypothetical protein
LTSIPPERLTWLRPLPYAIIGLACFGQLTLPLGVAFGSAGATMKGRHFRFSWLGILLNGLPILIICVRIALALLR